MIPVEQLQTIPLFATSSVEDLALLAPLFHRASYKEADLVCKQGDEGDAFFVIETGTLRVRHVDSRGVERMLAYLPPPNFFGESSLILGLPHDVTVDVFSEDASLWVLSKREFDQLLNEYPGLKDRLAIRPEIKRRLAQRVYSWLYPGEVIVVNTRRHWFALARLLLVPSIVTGVLLALLLVAAFLEEMTKGAFGPAVLIGDVLVSVLLLWTVGTIVWAILDWRNDWYIVTNKRVIHIEKVIGFFESRAEAPIEQVTNVQETTLGVAARVLGFSALRVETSGLGLVLDFSYAPRRAQIRQNIFEQIDRVRSRVYFERRERIRAGIRDDLQKRLTPPPASVTAVAAAPAPVAVRQRKQTRLAEKLNAWFGLRIEEGNAITWRKHWFILLLRVAAPSGAFLMWLGAGIVQIIGIIPVSLLAPGDWVGWGALGLLWLFGLLGFGGWWLYNFIDWRNDIYTVTEDRLFDIEKSPFGLREKSIATTLDRVQNVSFTKPNLFANIFNYGDVVIETAGLEGRLVFYSVLDPRNATQEIFRRRNAYREQYQLDQLRQQSADLLDWFEEYHRLAQHLPRATAPSGDGGASPSDSSAPSG